MEKADSAASEGLRRRLRDRLVERDGTDNPALTDRSALANHVLLVDDDLRQAALALSQVESFLGGAVDLLESENVRASDLARFAESSTAIDALDTLTETLVSLRRRLIALASQIG
jgi:hypothetical protein